MTQWHALLTELADQADDIARHYYQSSTLGVEVKSDQSPVSEADLKIEKEIRRIVSEKASHLAVLGEEYGDSDGDHDYKLIIDPIDGTKNFIRGIPYFACLLGIEHNGRVIAGAVSAPATRDRWWAESGEGAFHNGRRIHVSDVDNLTDSQAFHGSLFGSEASDEPEKVITLLSKTYRQRGFGDYVPHMYVAMGLGEFAFDFKLKPWDMAPLKIIVEEAGGKFTDINGNDTIQSGTIITSNGRFHDEIVGFLKD